jgi:D-serine deaminase-like pyridoxal phosphate-dependent protein
MIDVETPALLLHREVVERNLVHMAKRASTLGVALRPHIKTHKCLELGRRQVAHGAQGLTVSTLFEAEAFARGGFTDLTWAFPLDPTHIPHVRRIAQDGVTLRVVLDDLETARALAGSGSRSTVGITGPAWIHRPGTRSTWRGSWVPSVV